MSSRFVFRSVLLCAPALGLLCLAAGCERPPAKQNGQVSNETPVSIELSSQPIGDPLYKSQDYPKPVPTPAGFLDPVVIRNAPLALLERLEIAAQVDGELWAIATPLQPGEPNPAPDKLWIHPVTNARYRRLAEGDPVVAGQVVALLNDEKVAARAKSMKEIKPLTSQMTGFAGRLSKAGQDLMAIEERLKLTPGGTSERSVLEVAFTTLRAEMDQLEKQVNALNAQANLEEGEVLVKQHVLRTTIPGLIKHIHKIPGSMIKATQDVILEIENPNKLTVEGLVGAQYVQFLRRGMTVDIEPDPQVGQVKSLPAHQQEVTAITVGRGAANKPVIVTASSDRLVCVQDGVSGTLTRLRHPAVVKALATTATGKSLLLTGASDGRLRIYDLTAANPTPREMKGSQRGSITAVAFSPDGKYAASGDDQSIYLWEVESGERKYEFPNQHRGAITMLQFTPQSKLVSVGSDQSMLVWSLGQDGARVEPSLSLEQRSGQVPVLGVSPDGRHVLYDQSGKSILLIGLPEKRLVGTMEAPESNSFAKFAIFSPDGKLVLTGGSAAGRVQLWQVPPSSARPRTVRQFVCETVAKTPYMITAAAFAPDGSFAVVGTRDGYALVLPLPTEADLNQRLQATLTLIDSTELVEQGGKQSRLKAELANPDQKLSAGDRVTIVATPVTGK